MDTCSKIKSGYIFGQAITSFGLALVLMQAVAQNNDSASRLLYILPLIFALICFAASLFFSAVLYIKRWMKVALQFSFGISILFSLLFPITFALAWLSGLIPLVGLSSPWLEIFSWGGLLLFLALEIHVIRSIGRD